MGNINHPPIDDDDDSAVFKQMQQHQIGLYHLNKIGKFLESIIYHCGDSNTSSFINVNDKARISNFQIIGQCMKKVSTTLPQNDPFRELLNLTGKIEKIIGQIENELFHSLNSLILKPIQNLRCNQREKIFVYNLELTHIWEHLHRNENKQFSEKDSEMQARSEYLQLEIKKALKESNDTMVELRNNIYPFILEHAKCTDNALRNLEYLIITYKNTQSLKTVIESADTILVPVEVEDYRERIYKSIIDKNKFPILLKYEGSNTASTFMSDAQSDQINIEHSILR